MKPNIKVIKDTKRLFIVAADAVVKALESAIKRKGAATIAFAGGRSAQALAEQLAKRKLDWSKIHFFMIDDRLVPLNDQESNFRILNETLLQKVFVPKNNIHPFVHDASLPDEGASIYEDELALRGGMFDVIFVSSGEDGHCAGLYPHHVLLDDKEHFFATFHDSPKPPADRMTALPRNFPRAGFSLLLVMGEAKREALKLLTNKNKEFHDCPSKLVTTSHNHLILTDISAK